MIAFFTTLRAFTVAVRRGLSDPHFRALAFLVLVLLVTGDLSPSTTPTKVFTIVYVLLGLGILVSFLSVVAGQAVEARMERQQAKKPKSDDA